MNVDPNLRHFDLDGRPHLLRADAGRGDERRCDSCGGRGYRASGALCGDCHGAGVVPKVVS